MTTPGDRRAAVTLPNGNVLVMGGDAGIVPGTYPYTEIFELNTGTWSLWDLMNESRSRFVAVLLNNKVLAIGGARSKTAELYDPGRPTPSRREAVLQECNCPVPTFSQTPSHLKETRGW